MKNRIKKIFIFTSFVISSIIISYSCNLPTEIEPGSQGIIIPGVSVDGVRLGDLKVAVIAKLGEPADSGWADGSNRGWRYYLYTDSTESNFYKREIFAIYFLEDGAYFDTVDVISAGPSYKGRTEKGIGIGSSINKVHQVYGIPDTSMSYPLANSIHDIYCVYKKWFGITYKDSLITRMSIGNYKPYPAIHYCK